MSNTTISVVANVCARSIIKIRSISREILEEFQKDRALQGSFISLFSYFIAFLFINRNENIIENSYFLEIEYLLENLLYISAIIFVGSIKLRRFRIYRRAIFSWCLFSALLVFVLLLLFLTIGRMGALSLLHSPGLVANLLFVAVAHIAAAANFSRRISWLWGE